MSELFGPTVTTDALMAATGDAAWMAAMLDAEAALAAAQADVGLVPAAAAEAIGTACRAGGFDVEGIGRQARLGGNPVIPLVAALRRAVGEDGRPWVHRGATSQDILDTAAMLVSRRAGALIAGSLAELSTGCALLAATHRRTLMTGRTLLQAALPITFGLKAAGWLSGVDAAGATLQRAVDDLAVQLGGAAGTLASLGRDGPAVLARFAVHLELGEPDLPWPTARHRVAALGGALGLAAGVAAKISGDVALLMQTEVGEAAEPSAPGRGGSSTLPHKRNPVGAAAVTSAARRTLALLPVLYGALIAEHERPVGAWQAEWETLSQVLALAGGAVARTAETVAGLEVDAEAMTANLDATGGVLLAERVVFELAARVDGDEARQAVNTAAADAARGTVTFAAALRAQPLVAGQLSADEVDELLRPEGYLGSTESWIDRALAAHERVTA